MLFFSLAKVIHDNVLDNNIRVNFIIENCFKLTDSLVGILTF
jgi:hypothetical protein